MPMPSVPRAGAPQAVEARLSGSVNILVVDDEEHVLRKTRQLLETLEANTFTAKSTVEALQLLGSVKIDIALIDWRLGPEDGIALGRMLRRDYGIPFVVFSQYLDTDVTGTAYKLGAVDVIEKPLQPSRLLTAVNLAVRSRASVVNDALVTITLPGGTNPVSTRWVGIV